MGLGQTLSNIVLSLAIGLAELTGYKLKVNVDQHQISLEFVDSSELNKMAYDHDHYVNGNIFLRGYANPIKPTLDKSEDKIEVISSKRYKDYMKNTLIEDLIKSTEGTGFGENVLMIITAICSIITCGVMSFILIMMFA